MCSIEHPNALECTKMRLKTITKPLHAPPPESSGYRNGIGRPFGNQHRSMLPSSICAKIQQRVAISTPKFTGSFAAAESLLVFFVNRVALLYRQLEHRGHPRGGLALGGCLWLCLLD